MNWSDAADDGSPCSACWMKRTLLPRSALRVECVQVIVSCQRAAVCHHIRLACLQETFRARTLACA
ncbi:MAG: hypothetical protein QOJ58_4400 [Alphaproteobacteria bacterium]|nr:hypothetical protein [Alphaproteobacteria bacterium]